MKSSWHKTMFVLFPALAASALGDVLPPDHHVVSRGVALVNTEEFPDKVFLGVEWSPGAAKPIGAWRMRSGDYASVAYKFNTVRIYWALAADWPRIQRDLGAWDKWTPDGTPLKLWTIPVSGWSVDGRQLTHLIQGELETAPRIAPDGDPVAAEKLGYRAGSLAQGGSLALARTTTEYSDGRPPLVRDHHWSTPVVERGGRNLAPLRAALSPDGKSLDLRPVFGGSAELILVDAGGSRILRSRREVVSGEVLSINLPPLAGGRYLVTLEASGRLQAAWIDR